MEHYFDMELDFENATMSVYKVLRKGLQVGTVSFSKQITGTHLMPPKEMIIR